MSKWSVTIHQSNRNGSSSPKCRWVVDPPGYNHKNRNWGDHRWHVAHNGTPDRHPTGYHIVTNDPEYYYAVRILGPWGSMGIYEAQDIRPLALALLAHAERQEL